LHGAALRLSFATPMKLRLFLATLIAAFVASGCGQKDSASTATTAAAAPAGPRVIELTAGDTMKFNVTSIEAKPGEDLKVVLTNIGAQPKEVMGHNWVLLKAGTDVTAFSNSAMMAATTGYIPLALKDQILAEIELLGPRKSGEAAFKAPTAPGEYPFLCTFPGHYVSGMKGVLVVK